MKKKKILVISSRFPYPPIGGDKLKNYNLIKILSKSYSIHLVSLIDRKLDETDLEFCKSYCDDYKIFKKSKIQSIFNVLKLIFNKKPLQVNYYYFNDVQKYINKKLSNIDFSINTLIRTSEYIINNDKPKFLDMVDSIALNYQRSIKDVKSIIWKIIYQYEIKMLMDYEKKCIENYDNTFFVNNKEAAYWSKFGNTIWIPNGVNEKIFKYQKQNDDYKNSISFFGKMNYQPNVDAIIWFVKNVFYKLDQNIKLVIVGISPTDRIKKLSSDRIKITGFIDDPYEILNSCFAIVAPMQTGGGIQNKILETMALGKITVTTSLGGEPIIGAVNQKHFIIEDDPNRMSIIINDIFLNREKYKRIEIHAKTLIKQNYSWIEYGNALDNMIQRTQSKKLNKER